MAQMRIIGGAWRGRPLRAPAGADTRPTAARAREALFSMLLSEVGTFAGLQVADIFAGTGALGLEALSRGAAHAVFVEDGRAALHALRMNIDALAAADRTAVLARRVPALGTPAAPADLVFLDAPYGKGLTEPALAALAGSGWLAPGAVAAAEIGAAEDLSAPAYEMLKDRRYGKARVVLLRYSG